MSTKKIIDGVAKATRLYYAEYYTQEEITELIAKIIRSDKESREIRDQFDMSITPWEYVSIERNLFDDPMGIWKKLYRALYYINKEDVPLGINSHEPLPLIVFNWRAKLGK